MSPSDPSLSLVLNEPLPPRLRRELEKDARQRGMTLNDTAASILAQHFHVRYSPSGNGYRASAQRFKLRVPYALHRKIKLEAARGQGTVRGVTLSVLAESYGLPPISIGRRPRRKT